MAAFAASASGMTAGPMFWAAASSPPRSRAGHQNAGAAIDHVGGQPVGRTGGQWSSAHGAVLMGAAPVAVALARRQRHGRKQRRCGVVRCASFKEQDGIPMRVVDRALNVNLDPDFYGAFAEIGAGQEISRWFLRAGAAAGTVARAVSAYDMQMSDRMYGECQRYVTKDRMKQMLDKEYDEVETTLREIKGKDTRFFSIASTLAAKAYMSDRECEGWVGVKYQKEAGAEPSTVWMHLRMSDPDAELQGDAIGILGANLIYLVKDSARSAKTIVKHLLDDIEPGRLTINWVQFEGPGWTDVDDMLVALWLVMYNSAEAVVFNPDGAAAVPNLAFYKRPLLVQRGRFRMVSVTNEAIFSSGLAKLEKESGSERPPLPLLQLILNPLGNSDKALCTDLPEDVERDYLLRLRVLSALGHPVMVSGMQKMHELAEYLNRYTNQKVVIAVGGGQYSLERGIFRDSECAGLSGGLLEAFGKLFAKDAQMYVFPNVAPDGTISSGIEAKSEDPGQSTLLKHLVSLGKVVAIDDDFIDSAVLNASENGPFRGEVQEVYNLLSKADDTWKELVPDSVVEVVKELDLESQFKGKDALSQSPLEDFVESFEKGEPWGQVTEEGEEGEEGTAAKESPYKSWFSNIFGS